MTADMGKGGSTGVSMSLYSPNSVMPNDPYSIPHLNSGMDLFEVFEIKFSNSIAPK